MTGIYNVQGRQDHGGILSWEFGDGRFFRY